MTADKHIWQPGERAIYTDWAGKRSEPVTVIRYSRSRFGAHCVLVQRDDGKKFTIHERFLAQLPQELTR
jgi:hypothetical protein